MATRNNIDGTFPLTNETGIIASEDDKGTKILVELVDNRNKQVSWLLSNGLKIETIIVELLARCKDCISISSDKKSCEGNINKGPLTSNLPPYYICPEYKTKK